MRKAAVVQPAIIRVERIGDVDVIATSGELDLSVADQLAQQIDAVPGAAIVSLEGCSYIDSTILTVLVKATKARDGKLVVVLPLGHRLRRIFEIANVGEILNVAADLNEALAIQSNRT
jgi:anti-anti-sigma factor